MEPDDWQRDILCSRPPRLLMCCSRQSGKSQTAAGLAVLEAATHPGSLTLIVAPTMRQSSELFRKVKELQAALVRGPGETVRAPFRPVSLRKLYREGLAQADADEVVRETALQLETRSGSRVVSLPGKEASIRSYSAVDLLILDEAARIPDDLYRSVRPMLAISKGRLVALSSAWAKVGWFWEAAGKGKGKWERVTVTARQCPRISPEFLREEEEELGPRWFAMEYLCEFGDAIDALFTDEQIRQALDNNEKPLFM
jgi:hypothetical protein